tara:strand:+ start:634 stop:1491 length:858 start_codon:yes stop_codon:yes gene_type:complete
VDYIFYYKGNLPDHIRISINSILSVDETSSIYFCGSENFKNKNSRLNFLNADEIKSNYIDQIGELENFERMDNNPLWKTSLQRIFYIYEIAQHFGIKQFVHFDNDVIIYKPFEELKPIFEKDKFNITCLSKDMLIFGYSYIDNLEIYKTICDNLISIYKNKRHYEEKHYDGKSLVEMRGLFLSYLENRDKFNILPSLPEESQNTLFDPLSFGQYLGGRHYKRFSKGYIDREHKTYNHMIDKTIIPKYEQGTAKLLYNNKSIELANLHIHSKKLKKFLPKNYKNII